VENIELGESPAPLRNSDAPSNKFIVAGLDMEEEILRKANLLP